MRIAEVSAKCGLSIDTIRYYEKSGLCPEVQRGTDGKRRFSIENLDWLILLSSLRETGMPTRKMKQFSELYRQGNTAIPARKAMLEEHEAHLELQELRLVKCKALLAFKLAKYDEILGEKL
ncbi:MerR family transcriptional regulator [Roseibium algae]|uniref:MerR family transcriptional regulator n=1 Tax=Roseibium algae TaxID=3123038 RepID=A0ABU8TNH5_9HYPH